MANPEHLAILNQGVEAWNKWRKRNPEVTPDLSRANIGGTDLSWANFQKADIRKADISDSNLGNADLTRANLSGADLSDSDLGNADLTRTSLNGADLSRASLRWANLGGADLSGATLRVADLRRAKLDGATCLNALIGYTIFGDVDLSQIKGLETVEHWGPSTIGIDTIYRSGGKIPESFLRGAGVPEDFIIYMRSLVNNPIEYYSCFISYSSKDEDFAQRLHAGLQAANVRCWFAPHDMKIGDDILDRIDETIRARDKLLLILSHNSIQSDWVETEVKTAFEEERRRKKSVLFPVRLDDAVMDTKEPWAAQLRRKHIGDFTRWKDHDTYQAALDRLLRDLKASAKAS